MARRSVYFGIIIAFAIGGFWLWKNESGFTLSALFEPKPVRPFTLVDHNGKNVTDRDYLGQYLLVFFGYTYCPDVCPTGLTNISEALDLLGPDAEKVTPLFITIDPARDTPEHLKEYVENFHPRMVGLTGTEAQVAAAAKSYSARYIKMDDGDGDPETYFMGHTSTTFMTDPKGLPIISLERDVSPEKIAEKLKIFIK